MPRTDNQKAVAAYLPLALYDKLEDFKLEEDIKSDSKAINTILERWFFGDVPIPAIAKTNRLEERLSEVERICETLVEQVFRLRFTSTTESTVPSDVPSAIDSDVHNIVPSEVSSTIDSDVHNIVPSDVPDIVPSDVPSTIDSDVPDIVPSDVPSTIDSDVHNIVPSDVPDIVPSDVPSTIDSDVPDIVPSEVPSTIDSDVPSELPGQYADGKIVICLIDRDTNSFRYWQGFDRGFGGLLQHAKFYKSEATVQAPIKKILVDADYAYIKAEPKRFELRYNTVRYFKENPQFQPKGRDKVKA